MQDQRKQEREEERRNQKVDLRKILIKD